MRVCLFVCLLPATAVVSVKYKYINNPTVLFMLTESLIFAHYNKYNQHFIIILKTHFAFFDLFFTANCHIVIKVFNVKEHFWSESVLNFQFFLFTHQHRK